jgi:hypothetical protein
MIMQDQSRRLSEPLHWGRRERTAVAVLLSCVLLAVIGFGAYALTSGSPARAGCVTVTFASTLGAARLHRCGPPARALCASPNALKSLAGELSEACRKAGLPYDVDTTPSG